MNDTPEWIKQRNAKKKREAEEATKNSEQSMEAAMLVSKQGPEVWQRFIKGLALNAPALSQLEGEELFGSTTPIGQPGAETSCQVNVERRSVRLGPQMTRIVFHYAGGSNQIRVTPNSGRRTSCLFA